MDNRIIELETKIKDITNELTELKAKLEEAENEQQKSRRWKPQDEEIYYYINSNGLISCIHYTNDLFDKMVIAVGNYFATKEEAEFEAERLKVISEMREFKESSDRKWDCINSHYYIFYNACNGKIEIHYVSTVKDNDIFFESLEKAQECIEKVGIDRLKRFYLRVDD